MLHDKPGRRPLHPSMRIAAPVILGLLLLALWFALTATQAVPASLLPTPGAVARKLIDSTASGQLVQYASVTAWEAFLGCLLATAIGLPLGFLIANWRILAAAFTPYLAASQAIPAVAIAPLLVLWVGYGTFPVVLLCSIMVFFPVVLGTVFGVRHVDPELVNAARLDGAHGASMLRWIVWPLALPAILTGLRNGFTLSITGAVVGEMVMGGKGFGMILSIQSSSGDTAGLFATIVALSVLAIIIYVVLLAVEQAVNPTEGEES